MKIAIIGAGAMGCLYAGMLEKAGEVTLYDVFLPTVDAVNRHGILIKEPDGKQNVHFVRAEVSGAGKAPADLVIVFVKDTVSKQAIEQNRALIGKNTQLLSLQNGMGNFDILKEFADEQRILLGTTKHNCVTLAPGKIFHSGSGVTNIGSPASNAVAAKNIANVFSSCNIDAEFCADVKRLLWQKLFINMSINALTALFDANIGFIADNKYAREFVSVLVDEAVAVAEYDSEKFDGETVKEDIISTAKMLADGKASMCQDIEHKRHTEVDFINGAVVRLGEKYGVKTPYNKAVCALIHAKEEMQKSQTETLLK